MKNTNSREALLSAISELCNQYPHWRLGQLVVNVAGWADKEIWDVEDDELLQAARLHLDQLPARHPIASPTAD